MGKWNKHVPNTKFDMIGAQREKQAPPINKTIIHVTGPQRLNVNPFREALQPLKRKAS